MDPRTQESGTEFVLDNRKLIIGFLLLIAACGAFFVIGFMEGKRQSVEVPAAPPLSASEPSSSSQPAGAETKTPGEAVSPPAADTKSDIREQLDWYKSVKGGDSPQGDAGSRRTAAGGTQAAQQPASKEAKSPLPAAPAPSKQASPAARNVKPNYTVQVGAFTQRREAEIKADALKAKGFTAMIEEPKPPDQYYRVKAGKFDTRAEAVALKRKLEKAGFICIIKTS